MISCFGSSEMVIDQYRLNAYVFVWYYLYTWRPLLILACTKGSYGENCTLTCYDKCDGCNNVDGSCDKGCKPGWKGDNCQQRIMFKLYYNSIFIRNEVSPLNSYVKTGG